MNLTRQQLLSILEPLGFSPATWDRERLQIKLVQLAYTLQIPQEFEAIYLGVPAEVQPLILKIQAVYRHRGNLTVAPFTVLPESDGDFDLLNAL